jgi:hypothetical protein
MESFEEAKEISLNRTIPRTKAALALPSQIMSARKKTLSPRALPPMSSGGRTWNWPCSVYTKQDTATVAYSEIHRSPAPKAAAVTPAIFLFALHMSNLCPGVSPEKSK